ncbi:hypothetical protein F5883DRAFT_620706 [Diaporthe sp. PMI_573]|nr:hypothetical protein F5883DRAFT_623194 [Diaporthaceae sp. PMI_573]KAH8755116.1 hypothetical protein F5883DRAFT_620706 [Diaporthaceae sp. PMI_573]
MIKTISSTYTVDRSRIYACGKSNGGGFTSHLACRPDTSRVIAARTPEEGSFGPEPDVRLWRRQWASRNGCDRGAYPGQLPQPDSVKEVHPGAWEEVWDCPGAEVRSLSVEGLGHAWPSTIGLDLAGPAESYCELQFDESASGMLHSCVLDVFKSAGRLRTFDAVSSSK